MTIAPGLSGIGLAALTSGYGGGRRPWYTLAYSAGIVSPARATSTRPGAAWRDDPARALRICCGIRLRLAASADGLAKGNAGAAGRSGAVAWVDCVGTAGEGTAVCLNCPTAGVGLARGRPDAGGVLFARESAAAACNTNLWGSGIATRASDRGSDGTRNVRPNVGLAGPKGLLDPPAASAGQSDRPSETFRAKASICASR